MKIQIAKNRSLQDMVRHIPFQQVADAVTKACLEAATHLPKDVLDGIKKAMDNETDELGMDFLAQYLKNAKIAEETGLPLCQDTGFAVFFVEMGSMVVIDGGTVSEAITAGTERGYELGFLRKSIVDDPVFKRVNTRTNTPPIIHLTQVPGDRLSVILAPKGGGSENMSALRMLKPSQGRAGVVEFVTETVVKAGGNPCPPTIVGVGIGGTFEKAAFLAKKALLRPLGEPHPDAEYAALEREILERINASGVGFGG